MTISTLPEPVAAYIAATNSFDIDALMATFAEDALVNDHRDEFAGGDAIRTWAQREIIDDRVTMEVIEAKRRGDSAALSAIVRGNFDKTGLPDPVVLTFYFSVSFSRIVQLIIVLNKAKA
jgi:ketosteroid isomerase-like protein